MACGVFLSSRPARSFAPEARSPSRNARPLAIALLLTLLAVPALAQQQQRVYQWKDASGVTHYTDNPPSQSHKTRDINVRTGTTTTEAVAKSQDSEQCTNARNLSS